MSIHGKTTIQSIPRLPSAHGSVLAYGFLGFALGWMPAYILANIVAAIWPLLLIGVVAVAFKI
jgi:hypothetical protein